MAGIRAPKQVSRHWLGRYALPRRANGQFAPGWLLWTRQDGESRWLFWPEASEPAAWEYHWLSDEGRRVLTHLLVIAVAAFLTFWFW